MKGLLVPGLCCRSDIWEEAGTRLPGVEVVALDWPWPERIRSYGDGAAWLAEAITAHEPDFVVGHSFGGVLLLHLCSQPGRPPPVRLIIVDTFLITPHPFFRNHVWLPAPRLRERIVEMLAEERARFPLLREVASADDPPGWRERVLTLPAAYMYGGRSGEHAAAAVGEMAGIPAGSGRDVRIVPDASHFPMLERPAEFYATLAAILRLPAA